MKKRLCFVFCVILVILFCFTCSAQSVDISLDAEKSGRTGADVNVFVQSDTLISGGVFVVSFDDSVVRFNDVSSDYFEVDARIEDSTIEVVIASEESVDASAGIECFSVQFLRAYEDDFDISVEAKSLVGENLKSFIPDVPKVDYSVDVSSSTVKKTEISANKETDKKSRSAEISKKVKAKKSTTQSSVDEKELSEVTRSDTGSTVLKVDTPHRKPLFLIAMVFVMVVVAFLFGIVFRKHFFEKKDKNDK